MPKQKKILKSSKNSTHESESSIGTVKLQEKASQNTKNIFGLMLSRKSTDTSPSSTSRKKSADVIVVDDIPIDDNVNPTTLRAKSTDTAFANVTDDVSPMTPALVTPPRRKSSESIAMSLDDDYDNCALSPAGEALFSSQSTSKHFPTEKIGTYLTTEEFKYTIGLLDSKINALYKVCRYISDQQKQNTKSLTKLVTLDELSDSFWNQACRDVAKQLLPSVLFPSTSEYRIALEEYLTEHAPHFIDSIGKNCWISLFEEKLLTEVKAKCRSRRNDIASNIRHQMFAAFGEQRLDRIDNSTPPLKIAEWKLSEKTKEAYNELFTDHELLSKIGHSVFKQYKEKELPVIHCSYVLSMCDILLSPKSPGIKCNDKSVAKRVHAFLKAYECQRPITQEMMEEIAESEEKEAECTKQNKQENQKEKSLEGSEGRGNDDYDNFMDEMDSQFI